MHVLKIFYGETIVEFPKTTKIMHGGELEGTETQMADGTSVFDVVGFRRKITYEYDYVPQRVFDALIPLLRKHRYLSATILDLDNCEKTLQCSVQYPEAEAFRLIKSGGAVWHNVKIELKAKDVDAE